MENNDIPNKSDQESDAYQKNKRLLKKVLIVSFSLVFLILSFWAGLERGKRTVGTQEEALPLSQTVIINQDGAKNNSLDFSLFWKTFDLLKQKYVNSSQLESKKLLYGAIKGMLAATGDPYTNFLDPEENKRFNEDIGGSFEGIGAEMGIKNGILTVIAPLEDSPAKKAGLRSGDRVIKIDGESSTDMNIEEAVSKIRGAKGTQLKLTIFRDGEKETHDLVVQREIISVKSVKLEFRDNDVALVKISRFSEDTDSEFNAAVEQLLIKKPKGIILDLRNDPGGYLDAAINMASRMLPKDNVVVIEESGDKVQKKIYTRGGDKLSQIPVMILINEGSASASEILAGALKDNRPEDVTLIGKKSFGKGSVQELIELPQGTAAKITVARWLTPNGKQINEVGISPDIEVELNEDDYNNDRDPQLDKALEVLKEKIK